MIESQRKSQKKLKASLVLQWLMERPLPIKEVCAIVAGYADSFEGHCVLSLQAQSYGVRLLTVLPDHRLAGADYRIIYVWDTDTSECVHMLKGHARFICKLVNMANGWLASAALDRTVRVWDLATGACLHRLECYGMPNDLAMWNDNLTVAVGDMARLWNRTWSHTLKGHHETVNVLAALSTDHLATGSRDETVRLWADGKCVHILQGHSHHVVALIGLPDNRLASSSSDCTVRVWDTLQGVCLLTLEGHTRCVEVLTFNGKLISRSQDHTIRVWDIGRRGDARKSANSYTLQSVFKSANDMVVMPGGMLATCSVDTVQVWDLDAGVMCRELSGHPDKVLSVVACPDGNLATGSDGTVRVWE
jgi:WD40 repeat protein